MKTRENLCDSLKELLDVNSVAKQFDCSIRHLKRLSDSGRMPSPIKLGALVRWSKTSLERWIEDGCPSQKKARR